MNIELDKQYNPQECEDNIYNNWEKSGYFNPDNLNLKRNASSYSIIMPPPNVTGVLHLGHSVMLAIEDILIRYNRMQGKRALWIPGTDHAAIATQTKVEKIIKEEGLDRHKLGREKFLQRVNEFAQNSHDTIVSQVRKMGSSCDWSRESYTLDNIRSKTVKNVFKMMYDDGLVYRGERIVNWCPRCHSTLADDEVEHKEKKSKLYWIKYGPFVLATSRPETKLGDTAVAVHPDDKRYKDMVGKEYEIEGVLGKFKVKVVADKAVDPEFGSGAIKVTPFHSFVDNEIAQRHNLPGKKIIDEDGRMMSNCGKYAGMTTVEARQAIVADMEKMGLIDHIDEDYSQNISVCYRCDTVIEPLPSKQWFIDVNKKIKRLGNKSIKELSIEAVKKGVLGKKKINIYPERFEKNYFNWMENLRDWCISRQIWFGHQIPVWYKGEEVYVGLQEPQGQGWIQDEDTLDTWFSSGMWTFSTMINDENDIEIKKGKLNIKSSDFKTFHPTAVLETGYDILFFWIARMIIMTIYAVEDIPFQDVYLHGLVLDEKGQKMSKSKGNAIDPLDMIQKYGTDATRLSLVIGSSPGNDLKLNEQKVASYRNFSNKLWNISRYILSNVESTEDKDINFKNLTPADEWILSELNSLVKEITQNLDKYSFSQAGEKLRDFTWNTLADWYLEMSKFEKSSEKEAVLIKVLKTILKLWHPFIPFVTEKIWQEMGNNNLLMIEQWPQIEKNKIDKKDTKAILKVISIVQGIRNARSEHKVEPSKKIDAVIYAHKDFKNISAQATLIKSLKTGINGLDIKEKGEKIKDAIFVGVEGIEVYLLGAADKEKEQKRIKKEKENLEKVIKSIEGKLNNKEFTDKAPKEVVDREKERLENCKNELEKLNSIN